MKKTEISQIEKLIREADFENKSEAYSSIFDKLKEFDSKYPSDYLLDYYKGLVCYLNPDVEDFRTKMALKYFEKAFHGNPKYFMTQIYLGFCYFDLGEFGKALNNFKEVLSKKENWDALSKNHQTWRLVNLAEMVAVCNLKLGRISKFSLYYMPWKDLFYIYSRKKDFYFPESLVIETANFLKEKGDSMSDENIGFFRKVSLDLIGIIKGGNGFEEIYSKELKNLKNWDGHQQYQPVNTYSH